MDRYVTQAIVENALLEHGPYRMWEIPRIHHSGRRRFFEGYVQRCQIEEVEQRRQMDGDSPAVSEQKRSIEAGQNAARQDMLAGINEEQTPI